jgi:TRAP-type C4-dicarboxylate transport system substrate-binding protein
MSPIVRVMAWGCALAWSVYAQSPPAAQEWKLSTALGPAYPQGKGGELWATFIRERSGGRLAVRHFPGATLARRDPARELAALRAGAIDLAVGSASNWAPQAPELNLLSLPWLFPDLAAVDRALEGEVGARLSRALETAGVVPLAWTSDAFHELAAKRGVHTPADMKGLRVRVLVSPLITDTLLALGALPAAMGPSAAQAALGQGALDAEELTVAALASTRSYAAGARNLLPGGPPTPVFAVNRGPGTRFPDADRICCARPRGRGGAGWRWCGVRAATPSLADLARDGVTVT